MLFWTSVLGLVVSIVAAVTPSYSVYFGMRVLTMFFLTAGQTMSIAVLKDMFYFHERARKIGLWALLYIASPYLGPCMANFMLYGTGQWRDTFWLCVGVVSLQIALVVAFVDETWYNRSKQLTEQPHRGSGPGARFTRLLAIWQIRHHTAYFPTILESMTRFFKVITRPAIALSCLS